MIEILFVCTGNICRSPTAEGVFRSLVQRARLSNFISVDSAGTHPYHIGELPDNRAIVAAQKRGFDLSKSRARQVISDDFSKFNLILALDSEHFRILSQKAPAEFKNKVRLLLDFFSDYKGKDVPDPYYGGNAGFEEVLDLCEGACQGLLNQLQNSLKKQKT